MSFTLLYTGFEQTPDWPRILATGKTTNTCAVGLSRYGSRNGAWAATTSLGTGLAGSPVLKRNMSQGLRDPRPVARVPQERRYFARKAVVRAQASSAASLR